MDTLPRNQVLSRMSNDIIKLLPSLEEVYKDFHANPELSMQEVRTAKIAATLIKKFGYEVHEQVGVTGVVGLLKNGEGPTVMLRADMDALPMAEKTGLPYASDKKGKTADGETVDISHMCGHDLHVTWLMGAAELLASHRDLWRGTLMVVFQPGEEIGAGAKAMIDDGMKERFPKPDIILGQHVMVGEAGTVGYRAGAILSAGDSMHIKMYGRGAHGSMPQNAIDPVIIAASTVMRLQTIVSRELSSLESGVLTVGALQAGTKENIIPDDAVIKLNMRTYDDNVRRRMIDAVHRICYAECQASNTDHPPKFTTIDSYPVTENDINATATLAAAFKDHFAERTYETAPAAASEDFSVFGREWKVPYVFWFVGCTEKSAWQKAVASGDINQIPSNHSSKFSPQIHPTLQTGLETILVGALTWLEKA
ncbi:MAG: amidohydrolase [Rouxiella badensis]|uniref:amidohydrolase n=2 Tax=Rouxiella badensis TaxID=1646377 RepID=UPI003C65DF54